MISLTRMDATEFVLNSDHILFLESTPDTVITLVSGVRLMVRDAVSDVVAKTVAFRRKQFEGVALHGAAAPPAAIEG